jgi:hypothetical protein
MGDGIHPRSGGGLETVIRGLNTPCRYFTGLKVRLIAIAYVYIICNVLSSELFESICVLYADALDLECGPRRRTMGVNSGAIDRILR